MNIALFTDSDAFAGTERHILELGRSLRALGEHVRIACPDGSPLAERAAASGLPLIPIPKRGKFLDAGAVRTLRQLLRAGELDVVHAHNGRTALAAALAVRLAGRGRCVATQHFLEPSRTNRTGPKSLVSRFAHGWVDRNTHGHVAISGAVRDNMVTRGEASRDQISVVPNGITPPDPGTLDPADGVRSRLGVPDGAVLIFCASRLEPEKDVMTLVEAMPLLPAVPGAHLVIAGSGSQESVLRARVNDWQLADCVSLLGFRSDVMSLISAADIFVLPSKVEGFGLVLLEAMSLARPVVATAAGGPLEIVEDGVTGRLVPPSDPGALAGALRELILDPAGRVVMGERGRRRFLEHFTADRMAAETLSVYRRVLGLSPETADLTDKRRLDTAASVV
jgi:glycosyltransferase involved in cell wall biosynthesis